MQPQWRNADTRSSCIKPFPARKGRLYSLFPFSFLRTDPDGPTIATGPDPQDKISFQFGNPMMQQRLNWLQFLGKTAFRNLWRSPRRTVFSLLAIAASSASLILFQSFLDGVKTTFRENVVTSRFGHYQIFPAGDRPMAGDDNLSKLLAESGPFKAAIDAEVGPLAFMSRQLGFFGLLSNGDRSTGGRGVGVDAEEEAKFLTMTRTAAGKPLAGSPPNSLFVGIDLAKKLGVQPGSTLTVLVTTAKGSMNALDMEVVGTFSSGITELDENVFFVHFESAEALLRVKGSQRILLGFKDPEELQYRGKLTALVKTKFPHLQIAHWQELAAYFTNTMGWLEGMFSVVRVIILLIATLSIVNVFTITLLERTGEFGTLRAIGTSRQEVSGMIFVEAILQAFFGTLIGIGVAVFMVKVALVQGITMPPPLLMSTPFLIKFAIPWDGVVTTSILVVLVAGGSGILPAFKMARINIVEALGRNV